MCVYNLVEVCIQRNSQCPAIEYSSVRIVHRLDFRVSEKFTLESVIMSEAVRLRFEPVAWQQIEQVIMVASAVDIDHVIIAHLQDDAEGYESCRKNCLDTDEYLVDDCLSVEAK